MTDEAEVLGMLIELKRLHGRALEGLVATTRALAVVGEALSRFAGPCSHAPLDDCDACMAREAGKRAADILREVAKP